MVRQNDVEVCELKAMTLAAGKGTRLFPLTGEVPKPMAPIVDRPIIEHIFDLLARHGVTEVHANVFYLADVLLKAYGNDTKINGMSIHMSREDKLLGTAGGVKRLAENFDDTFIIVSGDALTDVDLTEMAAFHKEKGALATIGLRRVNDTSEFGVVELDEESNILGFQEKPDPRVAISTLANTGIYILEPRALDYIPDNTFFDFAQEVFPKFLQNSEKFVGYQGDFYWSDIGTLQAYRQAHYDALAGRVDVNVPGNQKGDNLWIGDEAKIHDSVNFEGRAVVGRDAVIGRDAVLSGDVTIGRDCWVRQEAKIKNSILLPGATVGEGAYLEDCIVGHGYEVRTGEVIRGGALMRSSTPPSF